MVEEKHETRDTNLRSTHPWLELFRGFQVAIDFRKLLLAAAGILVMAFGWWLLAAIFYTSRPDWKVGSYSKASNEELGWKEFKTDRKKWDVLHRAAGPADSNVRDDEGDLADSLKEYREIDKESTEIRDEVSQGKTLEQIEQEAGQNKRYLWKKKDSNEYMTPSEYDAEDKKSKDKEWEKNYDVVKLSPEVTRKALLLRNAPLKPAGELRTWPWFESRGPNPYMLVTGQAGQFYESGHFWDWLVTKEVPVLVEPLIKFLLPVRYLLHPEVGFFGRVYFILVILWTLAVWAVFGGAITRMAAVEVARREKIGLVEAFRFATHRFLSFFTAPLFPLIFVAILVVLCVLFGIIHMIPWLGDLWDGLLWPLPLLAGLVMAIVLIGLVGWPMMSATISTEGTDSWEAVSRSYSYVYQAPWHYIWYGVIATVYGAAVVFFVGFMGSLAVFLAKWGVDQTPGVHKFNRDPSYLFVYAPTSYHWRELLLQGGETETAGPLVGSNGELNRRAYDALVEGNGNGRDKMTAFNFVGSWLTSIWIYLLFLMILGFGYSYFWSSGTIIYLLMRRKVDDAEMDEVYLEEDDQDEFYKEPPKPATTMPPATPPPAPGAAVTTMVEPPSLRVPTPPPVTPPSSMTPSSAPVITPPPETSLPAERAGDGEPPMP